MVDEKRQGLAVNFEVQILICKNPPASRSNLTTEVHPKLAAIMSKVTVSVSSVGSFKTLPQRLCKVHEYCDIDSLLFISFYSLDEGLQCHAKTYNEVVRCGQARPDFMQAASFGCFGS